MRALATGSNFRLETYVAKDGIAIKKIKSGSAGYSYTHSIESCNGFPASLKISADIQGATGVSFAAGGMKLGRSIQIGACDKKKFTDSLEALSANNGIEHFRSKILDAFDLLAAKKFPSFLVSADLEVEVI